MGFLLIFTGNQLGGPRKPMGYGRVWVIRHMGYDRVDCSGAFVFIRGICVFGLVDGFGPIISNYAPRNLDKQGDLTVRAIEKTIPSDACFAKVKGDVQGFRDLPKLVKHGCYYCQLVLRRE